MADSTSVANLPDALDAYAGYVDGHWPTYQKVASRFPDAHLVAISTSAIASKWGPADCLDIESGDASPSAADFGNSPLSITEIPQAT